MSALAADPALCAPADPAQRVPVGGEEPRAQRVGRKRLDLEERHQGPRRALDQVGEIGQRGVARARRPGTRDQAGDGPVLRPQQLGGIRHIARRRVVGHSDDREVVRRGQDDPRLERLESEPTTRTTATGKLHSHSELSFDGRGRPDAPGARPRPRAARPGPPLATSVPPGRVRTKHGAGPQKARAGVNPPRLVRFRAFDRRYLSSSVTPIPLRSGSAGRCAGWYPWVWISSSIRLTAASSCGSEPAASLLGSSITSMSGSTP
jgi:hypothetical protein